MKGTSKSYLKPSEVGGNGSLAFLDHGLVPAYRNHDRRTVPIYFPAIGGNVEVEVPRDREFVLDSLPKVFFGNMMKGIGKGAPLRGLKKALVKSVIKYQCYKGGIPQAIAIAPGAWIPLEVIYDGHADGNWLAKRIKNYRVARGTKQRVRTYTDEITESMLSRLSGTEGEVWHYDDGAGSGRAPIKAAARVLEKDGSLKGRARFKLVDRDPDAVAFARKFAQKEGVSDVIAAERYDTDSFARHERPESYDSYGSHGRLDYFSKEGEKPGSDMVSRKTKREFIEEKSRLLKPGGFGIYSNMLRNDDKEGMFNLEKYGKWVIDLTWPGQLGEIVGSCRHSPEAKLFDVEKIIIVDAEKSYPLESGGVVEDPSMGIHEIVVARKKGESLRV